MGENILILGSSGMAGHMVARYLREMSRHNVIDVGPRKAICKDTIICDLEDKTKIKALIIEISPTIVINCTGILVKASEEQKKEAIWFNAYLPHLLSDLCSSVSARFIHISTDCVFSGGHGPYTESSPQDGTDFYGRTKALGEIYDGNNLTIRTSIIGPEIRTNGTGLFDWFVKQKELVKGYRRVLWSGVTTLELSRFILYVIEKNPHLTGLVHFSVSGGISKYELLRIINETFRKNITIQQVDDPVIDKRLINTRIDIGLEPKTYSEQVNELSVWIANHSELYHY